MPFTNGKPNVGARNRIERRFRTGRIRARTGRLRQPRLERRDSLRRSFNLHFGIPRKNGLRDDIQVLYDVHRGLHDLFFSSANDAIPAKPTWTASVVSVYRPTSIRVELHGSAHRRAVAIEL